MRSGANSTARRSRRGTWLGAALSLCSVACHDPPRPDIILITLDTTRADHLGCYGHEFDTSPHIDALAEESMLFTDAISTSSWTLPAHASLFTSKFAYSHGARYDADGPLLLNTVLEGGDRFRPYRARGLPSSEPTLAGLLRDHGYQTAAVVGGPWMKQVFGLSSGFEHYDDSEISSVNGRSAESITDAALRWLRGSGDAPRFLFLNYYDPHVPYDPPAAFRKRFIDRRPTTKAEQVGLLYDGEIAYMDRHIGRLLDGLRELGLYDGALIIVTADHGELLGELDRYGHGHTLTEEELRIPFIVRYPGGTRAGRDDTRVQLIDVLPLIADALAIPPAADWQGTLPGHGAHPILAEVSPLPHVSDRGDWRSLHEGPLKFVWNSAGAHELYRVDGDRVALENQIDELPDEASSLQTAIEAAFAALPPAPEVAEEEQTVDDETRQALEALGYLD